MRPSCLTVLALTATSLLGVLTPMTPSSASAAAMQARGPVPAPIRRIVRIDDRFVAVEISLLTVIGGAPIEGGNIPVTTAHVTLSINDGALLPTGLEAAAVRFEKQRGINPEFLTRLTEVDGEGSGEFELVQEFYQGDLPTGLSAQSFNVVVMLKHNGRSIKVPMGVVPVHVIALP